MGFGSLFRASADLIWLWLLKYVPKMGCSGKWKKGPEPAVHRWLFFDPYPFKSKFVKWVADLFQRGMEFGKIYDFKWFDTAPWLIVFFLSLLFFRG